MSPPGKFSRAPILCYVTDRKSLASANDEQTQALLKRVAAAAETGIDWIHIREKDLSAKELSSLTRAVVAQTKQINERSRTLTRIIVNDRLDVALSEQTGGVHLGQQSLPVPDVCKWLAAKKNFAEGDKFLVGVSCHSVQSVASAAHDGADYIFFGPVFATPSKARFGAPQGLQRLAEACNCVSIPVLAIGGITHENASTCLAAGASGLAAIRLFQEASDLLSLVTRLHSVSC